MLDIHLILASASPRRRALLDQLGVRYSCDPAQLDEAQRIGENAPDYVQRMAREKALAVAARYPAHAFAVLITSEIKTKEDIMDSIREFLKGGR